jgi:hypothetical protein
VDIVELLNDSMSIGATESKRVNTRASERPSSQFRPGLGLDGNGQVGSIRLDGGIEILEKLVRWDNASFDSLEGLDQTCKTGTAFKMANGCLDRTHIHGLSDDVAFAEEGLVDGTGFKGVTGWCACAMGFKELAAVFENV